MKHPFYLIATVLLLTNLTFGQTPILSYSFSGNTIDNSGNGNDGVVVNAVPTNDFSGKPNQAYLFNGSNSYISAGTSATLKVDTALTVMACVYPVGNGSPNSGGIIVNKEGEYSIARFEDGSLRFAIADQTGWDDHLRTGITLPLGVQTHVAMTYSQAEGFINIYVDSELVHSRPFDAVVGDHAPTQNELRVGGRQFLPQFFYGVIDEVKVYNVKLDADQIDCDFISSVTKIDDQSAIVVFPNPASSIVNIQADNLTIDEVEIYDHLGHMVKKVKRRTIDQIDIADLVDGIYYLRMMTNEHSYLTKRIIVVK